MKQKHLLAIIFYLLIFQITHSNIIDYNLSEYKSPSFRYQELSMKFDLSGTNSFADNETIYLSKKDTNELNKFDLMGMISPKYKFFKFNPNYIGSYEINFDFDSSIYYKETEDEQSESNDELDDYLYKLDEENDNYLFELNMSGSNKFYLSNSLYFLEADLTINSEYNVYDNFYKNVHYSLNPYYYSDSLFYTDSLKKTYDLESKIYNLEFKPAIGFGLGRIENISNAGLAIYILKELADQKKMVNQPDVSDIEELADLITRIKNKRIVDDREKKIYEITKIDSFFHSKQFFNDFDAEYFTLLYDNWDNFNQNRNSGKTISLTLNPKIQYCKYLSTDKRKSRAINDFYEIDSLYYYYYKNTHDYDNEFRLYDLSLLINFTYKKPINLYWQSNIIGKLYLGTNKAEITKLHDYFSTTIKTYHSIYIDSTYTTNNEQNFINEGEFSQNYATINLKHALSFYPNTRTELDMKISGQYSYISGKENHDDSDNHSYNANDLEIELDFGINYYISSKLRLEGGINFSYNYYTTESKYLLHKTSFDNFSGINYIIPSYNYYNELIDKEISNFKANYALGLTYYIF